MSNFGEVTQPKVKETNPKAHEVVLSDSETWKEGSSCVVAQS